MTLSTRPDQHSVDAMVLSRTPTKRTLKGL
ncbi:hypothetical protein MY4824_001756 [Beauveria thailandica]